MKLLHIPKASPDLNPIEKFWGWLRRELRKKDLEDLKNRRPALGKLAYKKRVRNFMRSKRVQDKAKAFARDIIRVCKEVVKKKGHASRS